MKDGIENISAMQWNSAIEEKSRYKLQKNTKNQEFNLLICNDLDNVLSIRTELRQR